jgi:hypothetical protein
MSEVAEFLRTRYEEAREKAKFIHEVGCDEVRHQGLSDCDCGQPQAILADCDAKLALVDLADETPRCAEGDSEVDHYGALDLADRTLYLLAQQFAGHPDHKGEEWAP